METLSTIAKLIGLVIFGAIVAVLVVFFGIWFLIAVAAMLAISILAWAFGVPITVTQKGQKIGYIRRGKFYRTKWHP